MRGQVPGDGGSLAGAVEGVIGVDEQGGIGGDGLAEVDEGILFVRVGLDEGVGHGAKDGDGIEGLRQHRGGAEETRYVAGPGRRQARIGAVGPPQLEIDQAGAAVGGKP